jgi:hypothetical protein
VEFLREFTPMAMAIIVATNKKEAKIARTSLLFFLDMEMYWPAWVIFFGFCFLGG